MQGGKGFGVVGGEGHGWDGMSVVRVFILNKGK